MRTNWTYFHYTWLQWSLTLLNLGDRVKKPLQRKENWLLKMDNAALSLWEQINALTIVSFTFYMYLQPAIMYHLPLWVILSSFHHSLTARLWLWLKIVGYQRVTEIKAHTQCRIWIWCNTKLDRITKLLLKGQKLHIYKQRYIFA